MKKFILILSIVLSGCGGGGGTSTGDSSQAVSVKSTCTLAVNSNTVPQSYYGTNSIPTPLSKFDNTILRGIGLKDYHPRFNLANTNCTQDEHSRLLYQKTLDRLQLLNVDYVEVYQYGPVVDFNATTWVVDKSTWQIPESELIWFIKEANSRNIKVNIIWQLWPTDSKGNTINSSYDMSEAEMLKVLRGWHNIIVDLAKFGGSNGLNILTVHWNAFHFPVTNKYKESATLEFLSIINDVRQHFNGKLFMGASPVFFDKRIVEKVDGIIIPLTPSNWSRNDDINISVSLLKSRYLDNILGKALELSMATGLDLKSIPVIWDFNIQSRDKALSEGWVEDGFCIKEGGDGAPVSWGNPECNKQMNYITDFSIQALAIEGAFQAIKEQTLIKTYGINFSTSYWHTDTLVPGQEGFPNLSQSIRGKPAENVVKHWFSKN
jgi:hypothetical protein